MVEQASQDGSMVSMGSLCMEWMFRDRIGFGQLPDTQLLHSFPSCGMWENGRMKLWVAIKEFNRSGKSCLHKK